MAFPTLSRNPLPESVKYMENEIRADFEGQYEHRRPRATRLRRKFTVPYDALSATDWGLIKAHFETVGTHTPFDWTAYDSTVYTVYYDTPVKATLLVPGWYTVKDLQLVEV